MIQSKFSSQWALGTAEFLMFFFSFLFLSFISSQCPINGMTVQSLYSWVSYTLDLPHFHRSPAEQFLSSFLNCVFSNYFHTAVATAFLSIKEENLEEFLYNLWDGMIRNALPEWAACGHFPCVRRNTNFMSMYLKCVGRTWVFLSNCPSISANTALFFGEWQHN